MARRKCGEEAAEDFFEPFARLRSTKGERKNMKTIFGILLLCVAALALAEGEVTGTWTGSFNMTGPDGQTRNSSALLILKQSGAAISGTVGPHENERLDITNGTIEGDKIKLTVERDGRTLKFDLVLSAGRITGNVEMARDGRAMTAKIDVTRAK